VREEHSLSLKSGRRLLRSAAILAGLAIGAPVAGQQPPPSESSIRDALAKISPSLVRIHVVSYGYEEGRDYQRIEDPQLNPWRAYHEPPALRLASGTRIRDGERLRVSYYHPILVYQDRVDGSWHLERLYD